MKISLKTLVPIGVMSFGLYGCQKPAPAERPTVTLPVYTNGEASLGKQQFEQDCAKCHRLKAGSNEKGPQLLRVYGSAAANLSDYSYSDALKNSQWTWNAQNLDQYIANPKQAMAGTKMKSDPISDPKERQNIIAYLSTLR